MFMVKTGGILVSAAPGLKLQSGMDHNHRTVFFLVDVTTERLARLTELFNAGRLVSRVGTILPLAEIRTAHEMLAGAPHKPGKIVLQIAEFD